MKITDYSEINGQVAMTIVYSINNEDKKDERIFDSKEDAMRYFASCAETFLLIRNQDFMQEIHKLKKHYLDNSQIPYINDRNWTSAFWTFLNFQEMMLKPSVSPFQRATLITLNRLLYKKLIPELHSLKRHDIAAIEESVHSIARDLQRTIMKLQDQTFAVNQNIAV